MELFHFSLNFVVIQERKKIFLIDKLMILLPLIKITTNCDLGNSKKNLLLNK